MKFLHAATLVAGVSVTAALGFAGQATAAPSGPSTVGSTVNALQADGYTRDPQPHWLRAAVVVHDQRRAARPGGHSQGQRSSR